MSNSSNIAQGISIKKKRRIKKRKKNYMKYVQRTYTKNPFLQKFLPNYTFFAQIMEQKNLFTQKKVKKILAKK